VPFDEASLAPPYLTKEAEKFILNEKVMEQLENSKPISEVDFLSYDAIFLPGGHGTCVDLPTNETLLKGLSAAHSAGKIISAVCHGPTGLVNVKDANGEPIVKGKNVTGFSDSEEIAVGKDHLVPFLLEAKLKEMGGVYSKGSDWHPHAVRDGSLITGQNPQSSRATADLINEALAA
jgi:putative intracellular protease/amidase